jgi:hypothetical protein
VYSDESTGDFNYQHGLHSSHHKKPSYVYEASSGSGTFWDRSSTVNAGFYYAGFQGVRHIAQKKLSELSCERRECDPKYLLWNDLHVRLEGYNSHPPMGSGSRVHTEILNQCV